MNRLYYKVYTVNDESQHLIIRGVPSVNLHDDVQKLCMRYGNILSIRQVQFEDQEEFTNSFHVTFVRIQSARSVKIIKHCGVLEIICLYHRFAKKQMDTKNFFGSILHVCYAPELETLEQTRVKLQMRMSEVTKHINKIGLHNSYKKYSYHFFFFYLDDIIITNYLLLLIVLCVLHFRKS